MKEELEKLLENSYSPYSHFKVAAIAVMKDSQMFKGVNVENASYGATICAERNAINNAIANGYKKYDFEKLYIMTSGNQKSTSCMLCRQVISEFFEDDKEIITIDKDKTETIHTKKELCPFPFDDRDLQ